jgi:hypothetical protein
MAKNLFFLLRHGILLRKFATKAFSAHTHSPAATVRNRTEKWDGVKTPEKE